MALIFPSAAPQSIQFPPTDSEFYSIIERLKSQNALPLDSFLMGIPFFNIHPLPKELQIRGLFEKACDTELCKRLLRNVAPISNRSDHSLVPQNYLSIPVMSFAQIVLYKVLPCPNSKCTEHPREIATHNQYKDFEYECPFYHHDKDRRRLVIFDSVNKEFVYKANYFEERKRKGDKEKYSQNYFESMFHPLYYKMFRCKRDFCNISPCCPFFHSEDEKNSWDETFRGFIGKDRVHYIKDNNNNNTNTNIRPKSGEKQPNVNIHIHIHNGRKPSNDVMNATPTTEESINKWFHGPQGSKLYADFMNNQKTQFIVHREGSDSSFEENQTNDRFFSKLQASTGYNIIY